MSIEYIQFEIEEQYQIDFIVTIKQATLVLEEFQESAGNDLAQAEEENTKFIWRIEWPTMESLKRFQKSKEYLSFHQLLEPYLPQIREFKNYKIV